MQAKAPKTRPFGPEAFAPVRGTVIRWLGNAGALINSRGTTVMIDPVLSGFDMPLLIQLPITEEAVPRMDAILLTHSDNDHYSRATCQKLAEKVREFHGPRYVADLLKEELGINGAGHDIGEQFPLGNLRVTLTPADHAWQNEMPGQHTRHFRPEDCCGFWLDTPDGSIWAVGDSRLMEEQLHMPEPDVILFDISDSPWHIGLDGVVKMAATYPRTPLILWHWGSVDAPEWKEFNGDPEVVKSLVVHPQRVIVLAPGESYSLQKLPKSR